MVLALSPATLEDLLERVEKATGPDRELDLAILKGVGSAPYDAQWEKVDTLDGKLPVHLYPKKGWETPEYRQKTDAWFAALQTIIETHPSEEQYRDWKTANPEPEWDWQSAPPAGGVPRLTGSLDSVLALVEEKLPGWNWSVTNWSSYTGETVQQPRAKFYRFPSGISEEWSHGATPPLAIITALLRALLSQRSTP